MVDCDDVLAFADSSGDPNDREEIDKPEGAVLIVVSEETMVDADGDSGMLIGIARGCWSVSGLGCTYGVILPVL